MKLRKKEHTLFPDFTVKKKPTFFDANGFIQIGNFQSDKSDNWEFRSVLISVKNFIIVKDLVTSYNIWR